MNFKQLFCRHSTLEVARRHWSTVPSDWKLGNILYVDDLEVVNYIKCCNCGKVYFTEQKEPLRAEKHEL